MVRCIFRMTGCAVTRTATTKVGMASASNDSRVWRSWASSTKAINSADRLFFLPRSTALAYPQLRVIQGRKMELYAGMVEYMD